MRDKEITTTIIQTKLHRPPLPVDLVPRPRLTEPLDSRTLPPLILISAPAGYGKSTLAKCLVEALDYPTSWLSLDEHDNDLGGFLRYFLAAVQTIYSDVLPMTRALLTVAPLPPISLIAKNLINELDLIEQPFIIVLDDYHLIETQTIHDLLSEVLLHPPRNLHLVIGTRMDPPLPLVTLRATSRLTEFRTQDLRFNPEETQQLFEMMIGETIDQAIVSELNAQAEGWVTGLRLAALTRRHHIRQDSIKGELSLKNRYVTEYLVSEILAKQAAIYSDWMLKTSILERFCGDLCEAVCFQSSEIMDSRSSAIDFGGIQFIEWLRASNLFVISLDNQQEWFRYHHLFRSFLQQELRSRLGTQEIERLNVAAGRWYAQNGWIEEALYHFLTAGDTSQAIQLIAKNRYRMMNTTQWSRLERWLNLFSAEVVKTSAELWMLKTWLVYHRGQFSQLPALLHHLAAVMAQKPDLRVANYLAGEISSLRSLIAYHSGDFERAISQAREALVLLDPELWIVRVMARMYLGGSLLAKGDASGGYHAFYGALEEEQVQNTRFKATLLMTACNFHWVAADLQSMAQAAKQCIALCETTDFQQILGYGNYQLARVYYQQNKLLAAEELFASVVANPYQNYGINYTNSACGLGFTYQALGKEGEAQQVTEAAIAFLLETGNTSQLPFALALQSELALRQGRLPSASQWAEKLDPVPPLAPMSGFLAPHLTLVKVWLTQNTPASRGKAAELLRQLQEYFSRTHNTRFLIETLALQALLEQTLGDLSAAQGALNRALRLAQPGGFIRLFVDFGPGMAQLISQLSVDQDLHTYVSQLQSAFSGAQQTVNSISREKHPEPLTNRELEILALLAERKTNKEIALQLRISPGTVRQHSHNLYQKLEVNNRREAVTRAQDFGILSH